MRKLLLAGVALAGVSAYLTTGAHAQSPVFPETTTPGKLDGAAPNSVTISIGFQQLTAVMAESGTGATHENTRATPQLFNWFHFFPTMDYVTPGGIHWGTTAEIRNNNSGQGGSGGGAGGNTFYVHSAVSYISSDKFGKFSVGTPNGALDDLGVGTGDDFGNGLFYSWYGPPNAPSFAMADSYDGDTPRQKLAYETPSFFGFKAGVSYEPTDVPLDHSTSLTTGDPLSSTLEPNCDPAETGSQHQTCIGAFPLAHPSGLARNRIEAALQFNKTFGAIGVKADVGYAGSGYEGNAMETKFQDVSYFNGGAVVTFAGIEVEGSVSSGKFNANGANMSPGGPAPAGSKSTTVYTGGVGYNMGPFGVGAVYYGENYDENDYGGVAGFTDKVNGGGVAGSYVVGPGMTLQLDAYVYSTKRSAEMGNTSGRIIALASQFAF
jgi:predicted porin